MVADDAGDLKIISQHFRYLGNCSSIEVSAPRGCTGDEGRPLEAGLQEQASNHLKPLWSKAMVVSVKEKSPRMIVAGEDQGDERKRITDEVSK